MLFWSASIRSKARTGIGGCFLGGLVGDQTVIRDNGRVATSRLATHQALHRLGRAILEDTALFVTVFPSIIHSNRGFALDQNLRIFWHFGRGDQAELQNTVTEMPQSVFQL
jgi:hypothetical protein